MRPMEAAFTEEEHRERLARARLAIAQKGYDCCICVAPEHIYYLAGYDAHTHFGAQAFVFTPGDDEPTLVIRDFDLTLAADTSWVRDVRLFNAGTDDPVELMAAVAREKGLANGIVGIDLQTFALPGALALSLVSALAPARVDDCSDVLGNLRMVKSEQEMVYVRQAATYANVGLKTAREVLRPGATESEAAGRIECAMRQAGGDYSAMPVFLASGPRAVSNHATFSNRRIEKGDLVHVDFSGVARRYHVDTMRTLSMGLPGDRVRQIYSSCLESLRAGLAAVHPGAVAGDIARAALEPLEREHLKGMTPTGRFGYGLSAAYPPSWIDPLSITPESQQVLMPGMVLLLHQAFQFPYERLGVIIGGTYALTDNGLEVLSGGDFELEVV